jgi:hypothetical protein
VVLVQLIAGVGVVDGDVATAASVNQTNKNNKMYALVTDYQSAVISQELEVMDIVLFSHRTADVVYLSVSCSLFNPFYQQGYA